MNYWDHSWEETYIGTREKAGEKMGLKLTMQRFKIHLPRVHEIMWCNAGTVVDAFSEREIA